MLFRSRPALTKKLDRSDVAYISCSQINVASKKFLVILPKPSMMYMIFKVKFRSVANNETMQRTNARCRVKQTIKCGLLVWEAYIHVHSIYSIYVVHHIATQLYSKTQLRQTSWCLHVSMSYLSIRMIFFWFHLNSHCQSHFTNGVRQHYYAELECQKKHHQRPELHFKIPHSQKIDSTIENFSCNPTTDTVSCNWLTSTHICKNELFFWTRVN